MSELTRWRRLGAEAIGTGFLLPTVVGSGIMAENLAGDNVALALLGNTIPTGAILIVIILMFSPISGAHFNPAVTLAFALRHEIAVPLAEGVATFGLVLAILGTLRWSTGIVAFTVGLYITAAYSFTASTSFANPAVTIGRTLTDSFSGILPQHAPAFVGAQCAGVVAAVVVARALFEPVRAVES